MSYPAVSVLIVNYNVKQYLIHAIDAIRQSEYPGKIEIIVVDNHSFDGSVNALREQYPECTVIANPENVGFGRAVNQGAEAACGTYLLILNPDTIIQEKTIGTFVEYLEKNQQVGMVGPKILNADGSLQLACKRSFPTIGVALPKVLGLTKLFPHSRWAGKYNLTYLDPDEIHSVEAISGSCMFIRAELFRQIGGFDDRFFMFGEDLDLCYRVGEAGYEVHYLPTTQIIHYHGESVKSAPYDSINAFYDAMILFADKHFSRSQSLLTRVVIRLGIWVRKTFALIGERRSQILSVILDGLVVLFAFLVSIPLRFDHYEPITMSRGLVPSIYVLFWIGVGALFQLYSRYILSYSRAILSSVTGFFIAVAFTYFFKQYAFSRLVIVVATIIITILIPGWRVLVHYLMSRGLLRPVKDKNSILFTRKTLIIGADKEGVRIAKNLLKRFDTGLDIIGFSDHELRENHDDLPVPFLGTLTDLEQIIKTYRIRELIFSTDAFSNEEVLNIMDKTKDLRLTYRIVPRHQDILLGKASIEEIGDYSFVNIEYSLFHRLHRTTKRIFDIIGALVGLIVFSPLIIVKLIRGEIKKISFWGEEGRPFGAYLFQSKSRFVREIPLLWSVLKGDMSLVGAVLVEISEPNPQLICKPGLTGFQRLRSVNFTAEELRLLDHYYVQNQSFALDLEILMKTVFSG
ncbi:MAG: glycosyltransferase [FCB group bacterium]|nr:glycosyltransferase [FCB group bacterium]